MRYAAGITDYGWIAVNGTEAATLSKHSSPLPAKALLCQNLSSWKSSPITSDRGAISVRVVLSAYAHITTSRSSGAIFHCTLKPLSRA